MRGIALTQPWASLVAFGAKKIETRTWATPYRGLVAIHAAKSWTKAEKDLIEREPFKTALQGLTVETMPLGVVLAVAEVVECLPMLESPEHIRRAAYKHIDIRVMPEPEKTFGGYAAGRFGIFLERVRLLPVPVAARGRLNIYELSRVEADKVQAQLDDLDERAGILEHEGGLSRAEAERLAFDFVKGAYA